MISNFRKNKLTKIIALPLALNFSVQQLAWAEVIDLHKAAKLKWQEVGVSLISGYAAGKAVNSSWGFAKTFAVTYGVPMVVNTVMEKTGLDKKLGTIGSAALRMAITIGLNAGVDAASGAKVIGDTASSAADEAVKGATHGFWAGLKGVVSTAFREVTSARFWNSVVKGAWSGVKTFVNNVWKAVTLRGDFWKKVWAFFTKSNVGQAMWRKSLQGAVYAAVKQGIYELIAAKHSKYSAQFWSLFAGLVASETVDLGLSKLTGSVAGYINKDGKFVAGVNEEGKLQYTKQAELFGPYQENVRPSYNFNLNDVLNDQILSFAQQLGEMAIPSAVQAIAAHNDKAEGGIIIAGMLTALWDYYQAKKDLPNTKAKRDSAQKTLADLAAKYQLTPPQSTSNKDLKEFDQAVQKKKEEYKDNQDALKELNSLLVQSRVVANFDYQIAAASKGYLRALLDASVFAGISYGLQQLSRAKWYSGNTSGSSYGEGGPVVGTVFNFFGSSLLKSLFMYTGYPVFKHSQGSQLPDSSTNEASEFAVVPSKKSFSGFWGFFDSVFTQDYLNVAVDAMSMGRSAPQFDISGKLEGVRLTNPYNSFFLARYDDYIQSKDFGNTILGIIPVGLPAAEQLMTSMHSKSVSNVQGTLYDLAYKTGVTGTSPFNKAYVYTLVRPVLNQDVRQETRAAFMNMYDQLNQIADQLKDPQLSAEKKKALEELSEEVRAKVSELVAAIEDLPTEYKYGDINKNKGQVKRFLDGFATLRDSLQSKESKGELNPAEDALLNSLDSFYYLYNQEDMMWDRPALYGTLMILTESYSDSTNPAVTNEDRQAAIAALNRNKRLSAKADRYATEKTKKTEGTEFQDARQEYLEQALKGIDVYEDLNGNNRIVLGIGKTPQMPSSKIKAEQEVTVNLHASVPFEFNSPKLSDEGKKLLSVASQHIKANPNAEISLIEGNADSYGTDEHNKQLSEERAKAVKDFLIEQGVPEDRLQTMGYGKSNASAVRGDVRGQALERNVEFCVTLKTKMPVEVDANQAANLGPEERNFDIAAIPNVSLQQYTVQPGDTLEDIARKNLGYKEAWQRILDTTNYERQKNNLTPLSEKSIKPQDVIFVPKEGDPTLSIPAIMQEVYLESEQNGVQGAEVELNLGNQAANDGLRGYLEGKGAKVTSSMTLDLGVKIKRPTLSLQTIH